MGYKIVYARQKKERIHIFRRVLMTLAFFVLFQYLLYASWPEASQLFRDLLIPQALETLASELRSGEGLGEAVDTFCQELWDGRQ